MINIPTIDAPNSVLLQMEQNRLTQLKVQTELSRNQTDEELMSVSRQFESIFVHQMLKSMRSTVQKSGLLDSHATRMYESMHDQELASLITEKRSIGLAGIIYKDLVRLEEKIDKGRLEGNQPPRDSNPAISLLS